MSQLCGCAKRGPRRRRQSGSFDRARHCPFAGPAFFAPPHVGGSGGSADGARSSMQGGSGTECCSSPVKSVCRALVAVRVPEARSLLRLNCLGRVFGPTWDSLEPGFDNGIRLQCHDDYLTAAASRGQRSCATLGDTTIKSPMAGKRVRTARFVTSFIVGASRIDDRINCHPEAAKGFFLPILLTFIQA